MATIPSVKIERIIKMTEFDVLRTKQQLGYMYMCLDTMKLYFDQAIGPNGRVLYDYISARTLNDLQHNIEPILGAIYYCWEDNSLWFWNNKWISLYSETTYPSGYVYDDIPSISNPAMLNPVYRYDMPNIPADDNGLLKDGSVVIRDTNRLIKGKLYIDSGNDNLVISSYLGGGIRLLPNGKMTTDGELLIDTEIQSNNVNKAVGSLRAEWRVLNNEMYVDYSEDTSADHSPYANNEHKYKVFHEGNLDTSALIVMTPLQVYNKLTVDKSTLPSVYDFNVTELNGKTDTDFAPAEHTHSYNEITDIADHIEAEAKNQVKRTFNAMSSRGITSSYNSVTDTLTLYANDFNLTLTGGVSGTARIQNLSDTTITVTVNPDQHIHQDLLDEIARLQSVCADLQRQIDELR